MYTPTQCPLGKANRGWISIDGELIGYRRSGDKLHELREKDVLKQRTHIGFVFQNFNLFPHLTVLENLVEAPVSALRRPRKEAVATQSEALQASSVSSYLRVTRREIAVNRTLAQPEDSVELKVWLPWWAPVVRVGEQKLLGSLPSVQLGHLSYGQATFETEALPFHHALFEVADQLGWTYKRCETWDVGGTKRPVEQQLWFAAGDDFEGQGFNYSMMSSSTVT